MVIFKAGHCFGLKYTPPLNLERWAKLKENWKTLRKSLSTIMFLLFGHIKQFLSNVSQHRGFIGKYRFRSRKYF